MRKRQLQNLRPGQKFAKFDNGPLEFMVCDMSGCPLHPDREPGVYAVRLSDGLCRWELAGLVVWTESQLQAALRLGAVWDIAWEGFHFPAYTQAVSFVQWCGENGVKNDGVEYPEPSRTFFRVIVRG